MGHTLLDYSSRWTIFPEFDFGAKCGEFDGVFTNHGVRPGGNRGGGVAGAAKENELNVTSDEVMCSLRNHERQLCRLLQECS